MGKHPAQFNAIPPPRRGATCSRRSHGLRRASGPASHRQPRRLRSRWRSAPAGEAHPWSTRLRLAVLSSNARRPAFRVKQQRRAKSKGRGGRARDCRGAFVGSPQRQGASALTPCRCARRSPALAAALRFEVPLEVQESLAASLHEARDLVLELNHLVLGLEAAPRRPRHLLEVGLRLTH